MTTDSMYTAVDEAASETVHDGVATDPDSEAELDGLGDIEDLDDLGDGPDDLDPSPDDDIGDDDIGDDDIGDDEIGDEEGLDDDELDPVILAGTTNDLVEIKPTEAVVAPAEADADDDVLITDEVEASLDVILAERMRARDVDADEEPDDEDEADDAPNQLATVIPVRRPDEFLCQSCFLLKPPGQLADRTHQLCRDCA